MQAAFLILEDLRLPASPVLFSPMIGYLVFARIAGSGEEARGLRHAVLAGRMARIYLPDGSIRHISLHPDTRLREEAIWIKGLPRVRTTLYLPAARMPGDETRWLFLVGARENFYDLIEAVSPFPVPHPARRLPAAAAAEALAWMSEGQKGLAPAPDAQRLGFALEARTAPSGENARSALPMFVRPLQGLRPEEWIALAIREDFLPILIEALA